MIVLLAVPVLLLRLRNTGTTELTIHMYIRAMLKQLNMEDGEGSLRMYTVTVLPFVHGLILCRFDPLGLKPTSAEEFNTLQTKELNNGRLAMISVAGFVAQELVNKKGIIETLKDST